MKLPIDLRVTRDFGQIINDSFTFLKENFKPLFRALLIVCGIFILIGTITSTFTYMGMIDVYGGRFSPEQSGYELQTYSLYYFISLFFNAIVMILLQASILLVTLCYISVYLEKGNTTPTFEEVWGYFKYYMWRAMGSGILIVLLFFAGFILCFIPGIYLTPMLYLILPIIVMENASFRYAFNKSFRLVKGNWWMIFGVIFVMSLIISIAGSIVNVPLGLLPLMSKFVSLKTFATAPLIIIFSALRNVLMLAYSLPAIAIAMCYFSTDEEKESTGLINRIDNFGKSTDDETNLPAEDF